VSVRQVAKEGLVTEDPTYEVSRFLNPISLYSIKITIPKWYPQDLGRLGTRVPAGQSAEETRRSLFQLAMCLCN